MHFAIVEDDKVMQRWLRDKLTQYLTREHRAAEFDLFSEGEALLAMAEDHFHFDAVFLDIEMPGMDGIEVARRLAALMPQARVLFVSAREELVYDTFAVRPFRFLPKRRLEEMLPGALKALLEDLGAYRSPLIVFTDAYGDLYSFPPESICYIEARNKDCRIVTRSGESILRSRLLDIEAMLPGEGFIKIHRSYIVNAAFIYLIGKKSVTLTTGEELPLARNRADEVRRTFLQLAGGSEA